MAEYKHIIKDGSKVQVDSAIRDGDGYTIATRYMPKAGGIFTGTVKFNEVDGQCINFGSGFFINKEGGSTLIGSDSNCNYIGCREVPSYIRGSGDRPLYQKGNNTASSIALLSDVKVNNGTGITVTNNTTVSLKPASSSELGGIKISYNSSTGELSISTN